MTCIFNVYKQLYSIVYKRRLFGVYKQHLIRREAIENGMGKKLTMANEKKQTTCSSVFPIHAIRIS